MVDKGRPVGNFNLPDSLFLKYLRKEFLPAERVRQVIFDECGLLVSWNTVVRRLDLLVDSGVISGLRVGRMHLYRRLCEDPLVSS